MAQSEGYKPPLWLEQKRANVEAMEKSVTTLQEEIQQKRETKLRQRAKEDICFWMDNAIFPFIEGIADSFHEPLLDGIRRLIREKKNPFRPKEEWDRTNEANVALIGFLSMPQTQILQVLAKPYIRAKSEWLRREAIWVREEILKEEYPDIYNAIMTMEGGSEWLDQLINDFMKTLRRLIQ